MSCLRFKIEDFNPQQQARIRAQLAPRNQDFLAKTTQKNLVVNKTHENAPRNAPDGRDAHLHPYSPKAVTAPKTRNLRDSKMSTPERRFLDEVLHGNGRFEAITLKLAGGTRYTPDFFYMDGDTPVLAEIKGNFRLGSEGRAHTAFLEAAAQFPIFRFVWAKLLPKNKGWDLKYVIPADPDAPTTPHLPTVIPDEDTLSQAKETNEK